MDMLQPEETEALFRSAILSDYLRSRTNPVMKGQELATVENEGQSCRGAAGKVLEEFSKLKERMQTGYH